MQQIQRLLFMTFVNVPAKKFFFNLLQCLCIVDFFQVDNNDSCLGTPSNDIFMVDIEE